MKQKSVIGIKLHGRAVTSEVIIRICPWVLEGGGHDFRVIQASKLWLGRGHICSDQELSFSLLPGVKHSVHWCKCKTESSCLTWQLFLELFLFWNISAKCSLFPKSLGGRTVFFSMAVCLLCFWEQIAAQANSVLSYCCQPVNSLVDEDNVEKSPDWVKSVFRERENTSRQCRMKSHVVF